jgi:hypothetical protein
MTVKFSIKPSNTRIDRQLSNRYDVAVKRKWEEFDKEPRFFTLTLGHLQIQFQELQITHFGNLFTWVTVYTNKLSLRGKSNTKEHEHGAMIHRRDRERTPVSDDPEPSHNGTNDKANNEEQHDDDPGSLRVVDGNSLGREDHEDGGQVPVSEPQEARQHGDGDLGAEKARPVQAAVEERVEQEPRKGPRDGGAAILEEVDSGQGLADEVEHVVGGDEDDGVPVPERLGVHVLRDVPWEDGERDGVDERHSDPVPLHGPDDAPQRRPPRGARHAAADLRFLRPLLHVLVVYHDREPVRHVVAHDADDHEDYAGHEVEDRALP